MALAGSEEIVVLTADRKLIKALDGTPFASLLQSLDKVEELLEGA